MLNVANSCLRVAYVYSLVQVDVKNTEYLTESLHLAGRLERASSVLNEQAAAATLFTSIHNPNQSG